MENERAISLIDALLFHTNNWLLAKLDIGGRKGLDYGPLNYDAEMNQLGMAKSITDSRWPLGDIDV